MVVQHNISAMTANRYYGINNKGLAGSLEKLASGYAINKAGDNAAGLAVSEKMRAQIGGLTQASKNAEDGISLVQTMEGALQETDSILQRMRTLAVQSANGSYQDDVDRDAIQLEFDQLNDELNQIADTDFNGVVMLNGGQMADGLQAHNGKFDYATKQQDVTDQVSNYLDEDIAKASAALNKAEAALKENNYDLSSNGRASEWNTVDNSAYDKDAADAVWQALNLDKAGDGTGAADLSKGTSVSVTFKATVADDGTITWAADKGTVTNGNKTSNIEKDVISAAFDVAAVDGNATTDPTGEGGFTVETKAGAGAGTAVGNVLIDAREVKTGDTVTLNFTNAGITQSAPTNIGFDADTKDVHKNAAANKDLKLDITLGSLADADMDQAVEDSLAIIENSTFTAKYDGTAKNSEISFTGRNSTTADPDKVTLDLTKTTKQAVELKNDDGTTSKFYAKLDAANKPTTITLYAADENGDATDTELATITIEAATAHSDPATNKDGTEGYVTGKISISSHGYKDATTTVSLSAGDDPALESSNELRAERDAAEDALRDAQLKKTEVLSSGWDKIKDFYASKQSSSGAVVSVSDSLDNSKAKMTYTDQMSLQVGARTKDLVNFTFSYQSDDLGGLEKNLNCSAREGGLNTANLSVSTQKDANDAIDQIDKALNKVNMVRATFGAVQNRLEHKINNIDTNTENLTAAESRIRDTQMDKEMMKFTSAQILSQASQSMLAQANSLPQGVLQLLG